MIESKETLPLGFRRSAREDAQSITHNTICELEEVATCCEAGEEEGRKVILERLNYFMSDRAANEKKSASQMQEWIEKERERGSIQPRTIYTIHCMTHVLLGFHKYCTAEMDRVQGQICQTEDALGRDAHPQYRMFKRENAVSRIVRMTSELLGPNVDERCGLRDKWLADCRSRQRKSLIGDYRDNRFNGLFCGAAQVIFHLDEILGLENRLKTENLKVKSMFLDLRDSRLVAMIQAVAIAFIKITDPYWRLTMSNNISYMELYRHIQPLHTKLLDYATSPEKLLDEGECPLECFPPDQQQIFYKSCLEIRTPDRSCLLLQTLKALVDGMITTVQNQLSDFLAGGKYSDRDDTGVRATEGSGLNNMVSERNFGTLDASQKRRRHASLHFHSTIMLLKANRKILFPWIMAEPGKEIRKLLLKSQLKGQWLRSKHRAEEQQAKEKEQMLLLEEEAERKKRADRKRKLHHSKPSLVCQDVEEDLWEYEQASFTPITKMREGEWVAVAYETGWFPGKMITLTCFPSLTKTKTA